MKINNRKILVLFFVFRTVGIVGGRYSSSGVDGVGIRLQVFSSIFTWWRKGRTLTSTGKSALGKQQPKTVWRMHIASRSEKEKSQCPKLASSLKATRCWYLWLQRLLVNIFLSWPLWTFSWWIYGLGCLFWVTLNKTLSLFCKSWVGSIRKAHLKSSKQDLRNQWLM